MSAAAFIVRSVLSSSPGKGDQTFSYCFFSSLVCPEMIEHAVLDGFIFLAKSYFSDRKLQQHREQRAQWHT